MKIVKSLAAGMIVMCVLSGCGNVGDAPTGDGGQTVEESSMPQESSVNDPTESSAVSSKESSADPADETPAESLTESSPEENSSEDVAAEETELTEEEQTFFTDYIQNKENYGFLLSEYDAPEDVNLFEVLYSGAGFGEEIPEEDKAFYLNKVQQDEIYTDCLKMSRQDIDDFLRRKLGLGLADMTDPLDMVYLEETDAYYNQAGDTNYLPFACTGGIRQGDTYTLRFTPAADWAMGAGDRETVLVKTEDSCRFVSNHILVQ